LFEWHFHGEERFFFADFVCAGSGFFIKMVAL